MGGTFDPIHHGHLLTAEEALWQFELDEVVFVPTGLPWMKEHRVAAPAADRYEMTVVATSPNEHFSVSRVEIDREGPTHTVETLRALKQSDDELFFVTGADAVLQLSEWKEPDEILRLSHVIAATRPGYDISALEEGGSRDHPSITVMNIPALAISSTDIRERVAQGRPIRYLVPDGVKAYIETSGLYAA